MGRSRFTELRPTVAVPAKVNCRDVERVEIHIGALSGGDTIAVSRSPSDANYVAWNLTDQFYVSASTPFSADGIYTTEGGAWLKFTKTGSASSPVITLRLIDED